MDDRPLQVCEGCGVSTRLERWCEACLTPAGAFFVCEACEGAGEHIRHDDEAVPCAACDGSGSVWLADDEAAL